MIQRRPPKRALYLRETCAAKWGTSMVRPGSTSTGMGGGGSGPITRAGFSVASCVRAAGLRADSGGGGVDNHCCFWRCWWSECWMTHPTMGTFRATVVGVRVSIGSILSSVVFPIPGPWRGRRDRMVHLVQARSGSSQWRWARLRAPFCDHGFW